MRIASQICGENPVQTSDRAESGVRETASLSVKGRSHAARAFTFCGLLLAMLCAAGSHAALHSQARRSVSEQLHNSYANGYPTGYSAGYSDGGSGVMAVASASQEDGANRDGAKGKTSKADEGQKVFDGNCARCHVYGDAPNLDGLFKDKALPSGADATDENVREKILRGGDIMPAYKGKLSDAQIDALIAYLHTT